MPRQIKSCQGHAGHRPVYTSTMTWSSVATHTSCSYQHIFHHTHRHTWDLWTVMAQACSSGSCVRDRRRSKWRRVLVQCRHVSGPMISHLYATPGGPAWPLMLPPPLTSSTVGCVGCRGTFTVKRQRGSCVLFVWLSQLQSGEPRQERNSQNMVMHHASAFYLQM